MNQQFPEIGPLSRAFVSLVAFAALGLTVASSAVLVASVFGWHP